MLLLDRTLNLHHDVVFQDQASSPMPLDLWWLFVTQTAGDIAAGLKFDFASADKPNSLQLKSTAALMHQPGLITLVSHTPAALSMHAQAYKGRQASGQ